MFEINYGFLCVFCFVLCVCFFVFWMYFFSTHSLPMLEKLAPNYDGFFQEQAIKKSYLGYFLCYSQLSRFFPEKIYIFKIWNSWLGRKKIEKTNAFNFIFDFIETLSFLISMNLATVPMNSRGTDIYIFISCLPFFLSFSEYIPFFSFFLIHLFEHDLPFSCPLLVLIIAVDITYTPTFSWQSVAKSVLFELNNWKCVK